MNQNDNPLQGEWLVESQILTEDNRWVDYIPFPNGKQMINWTFHDGKLTGSYINSPEIAHIFKDHTMVTEYFYDAKERKLYIDRSSYYADGRMDECENEIYRVEMNGGEPLLYDLEDVEIEPDDYCFRLILKKIPQGALA